jgi:hypothetical protein
MLKRGTLAWQLLRQFGPGWIAYRAKYALQQRLHWFEHILPVTTWEAQPLAGFLADASLAAPANYLCRRREGSPRFFFSPGQRAEFIPHFAAFDEASGGVIAFAERIAAGEFTYFSRQVARTGFPPDWHTNPFTGQRAPADRHWSRIGDFETGDIKVIWEPSRFGFAYTLVRAYWRTGEERFAEIFWRLIEDWRAHNCPQAGVNWKCGQEASFRVMAWCFGLYGFASATASSPERIARLAQMLAVTGQRIASNLSYALSQRNNHGISEAAGLWTLGTLFPEFRLATKWRAIGKRELERQAQELIYDDGGFSQHSANYHRVMVEDYLWCIQLGRMNGDDFSPQLLSRVSTAGKFLASLMEPETGRLPNWGANDGAHVLPLSNCGYLDYRPVVQAAAMIAGGKPSLPSGPWDEEAWWLGCPVGGKPPIEVVTAGGRQDFPDSGLTVLRQGIARVVLRTLRRFRHRPAHCDLLHLDLWVGQNNILRDSGSYSYNSPDDSGSGFKSVAAHNTVQFDGHEQMPVLGRFLYGHWPQGEVSLPAEDPRTVIASYSDWQGCRHERTVKLGAGQCLVSDRLSGFKREAVLRWHLSPNADWELTGSTCASRLAVIRITAAKEFKSIRLAEGWESLFYNAKTTLSVFEVTVAAGCGEIETQMEWEAEGQRKD